MLRALLGFFDYTGTIEIDGIDIASIPRDVLRSWIIAISQEPILLDGTIRSNLLPYEPPPDQDETEDERAEAAAEADEAIEESLADLGILEEVQAKGGLYVNMKSAGFSKDEIQTLCFVRTVLRYHRSHGKLVLLDEATNGMDIDQDTAVQESIWEYFEGCTIVQVAHLQESTEDSELSIEISRGQLVHTRRGPVLPPGVVSRSYAPLSPESLIRSPGSAPPTPNPLASPRVRPMTPDKDVRSLDSRNLPVIPALRDMDGELMSPDAEIMALRDELMQPYRDQVIHRDAVPPGAHRVPSTQGAASMRVAAAMSRIFSDGDSYSESDAASQAEPPSNAEPGSNIGSGSNMESGSSIQSGSSMRSASNATPRPRNTPLLFRELGSDFDPTQQPVAAPRRSTRSAMSPAARLAMEQSYGLEPSYHVPGSFPAPQDAAPRPARTPAFGHGPGPGLRPPPSFGGAFRPLPPRRNEQPEMHHPKPNHGPATDFGQVLDYVTTTTFAPGQRASASGSERPSNGFRNNVGLARPSQSRVTHRYNTRSRASAARENGDSSIYDSTSYYYSSSSHEGSSSRSVPMFH